MEKRLAFPTVLIVLVVAAGALGRAQGARAHRGSSAQSNAALTVKAYGGLARRGFPVYLAFRVKAAGAVKVRLTMRLRTHVAVSGTVRRNAPSFDTRQLWKSKVSRAVPAGRYTFCAVATDDTGHRAKSCVFYRVV